jgi:hypothetical protein
MSQATEAEPEVLQYAMSELLTFAQTNFTELSNMERRMTGSASSMDIFCRMDIGMIQTEDGSLDYFVNEVEKGINVCLWGGEVAPHLIGLVGSKLGPALHSWVRENI